MRLLPRDFKKSTRHACHFQVKEFYRDSLRHKTPQSLVIHSQGRRLQGAICCYRTARRRCEEPGFKSDQTPPTRVGRSSLRPHIFRWCTRCQQLCVSSCSCMPPLMPSSLGTAPTTSTLSSCARGLCTSRSNHGVPPRAPAAAIHTRGLGRHRQAEVQSRTRSKGT